MKKALSILLALNIGLSLIACGQSKQQSVAEATGNSTEMEEIQEPADASSEQQADEAPEITPVYTTEADVLFNGKTYHYTYEGAEIVNEKLRVTISYEGGVPMSASMVPLTPADAIVEIAGKRVSPEIVKVDVENGRAKYAFNYDTDTLPDTVWLYPGGEEREAVLLWGISTQEITSYGENVSKASEEKIYKWGDVEFSVKSINYSTIAEGSQNDTVSGKSVSVVIDFGDNLVPQEDFVRNLREGKFTLAGQMPNNYTYHIGGSTIGANGIVVLLTGESEVFFDMESDYELNENDLVIIE